MDKRRIAPTFMLPEKFPDPEVRDIYVVLRGGWENMCITSAHEFAYQDYLFGRPMGEAKGVSKKFRVVKLSFVNSFLEDLAKRNEGYVDWTMVLEQGQRAYENIKRQLGFNDDEKILRITPQRVIF